MPKITDAVKDFIPSVADPVFLKRMQRVVKSWCDEKDKNAHPNSSVSSKFSVVLCSLLQKKNDDKSSHK